MVVSDVFGGSVWFRFRSFIWRLGAIYLWGLVSRIDDEKLCSAGWLVRHEGYGVQEGLDLRGATHSRR